MGFPYQRRLRDLREDHDKTQQDIADILGTSQTMYARYERGANELPLRHLLKLADYYGVSADYLLGRTDDKSGARSLISEDSVISQLSRRDRQVLLRVAEGLHAASVQKQEAMKSSRTQKIVPPADVQNAR